jgi:hypothetical protein
MPFTELNSRAALVTTRVTERATQPRRSQGIANLDRPVPKRFRLDQLLPGFETKRDARQEERKRVKGLKRYARPPDVS